MKAIALPAVAVIGLLTATAAKADPWSGGPFFMFAPYNNGQHHSVPYFVAGWGDDNYEKQRRYWGGPFWVENCGDDRPYETYTSSPRHCRIAHRRPRARP
jgi:hypothetical protein